VRKVRESITFDCACAVLDGRIPATLVAELPASTTTLAGGDEPDVTVVYKLILTSTSPDLKVDDLTQVLTEVKVKKPFSLFICILINEIITQ